MSPLFAALPPADLPLHAFVAPTGVHATAPLATSRDQTHTVRSGDTVYDIAATYGISAQAVVRANDLSEGGRWILPGTVLRIPGGTSTAAPTPASPSAPRAGTSTSAGGTVTVRSGDTLSHLAVRHGVSVDALVSANAITDSRRIQPGQVLVVPTPGGSGTPTRTASPAGASSPGSAASTGGTVTVRAGDTLYDLAARHGTTVSALAGANALTSTRIIHVGQKLTLPGGPAPAVQAPARNNTPAPPRPTSTRPYDETTIGDVKSGEAVPSTFLHYRYSDGVSRAAAANREHLSSVATPSRTEVREMIIETSRRHGVDPALMVALAYQESGWNHGAVSPANAIGAMQVIPSSGQWASALVGRDLNLLDPQDNVTAGVVIMRALHRSAETSDQAIGGYYQGLASVRAHGLFSDTQQYVRNIKHLMKTL